MPRERRHVAAGGGGGGRAAWVPRGAGIRGTIEGPGASRNVEIFRFVSPSDCPKCVRVRKFAGASPDRLLYRAFREMFGDTGVSLNMEQFFSGGSKILFVPPF